MQHSSVSHTGQVALDDISEGKENSEPLSELEYSVEHAEALVHAAVGRLSRSYPENAIDGPAL